MALDPQAQALLDLVAAFDTPALSTLSVEDARKALVQMGELSGLEPEPVAKVEDRLIPGPAGQIPVRVYTPQGSGSFPVLVWFHGGGFALGSIEIVDDFCRALTNAAGCITVSVDYRLAPEHKFPAAVDDCYTTTRWVAENANAIGSDPTRIAVGGDSAGGNLAAVVALMARDRGTPPLVYQLLVYPVTNFAFDTPSHREYADGYFLTKDDMAWFCNLYLRSEADSHNPYASPLQAQDLRQLPPALVITGEFDPLRDEGEAYAARMHEAGVPVVCKRYNGMIHGFLSMPLDQGKKARQEAAAGLQSAFAR
jgi:acetyl esterase